MKYSIIIPNFNGNYYLKTCLESIKKLEQENEVIVVDNSSADDSIRTIELNYDFVNIIRLNKNYGFSKAVNEGIKAANGEYIILLNNDTEIEKDFVANLINCIEKDQKIFSCCSRMIKYKDKTKIDDAGDEYTILGWAYKRGDNQSTKYFKSNTEVFSSCAGAAIYRREVFDKIGYFDENFFAYMEDVDISYRARIYGYKSIYCSNAIVYHVGSATSGSKYNSFKVKLAARNNIYVIYKNMPILQLIINSPFLLLGFVIKILFFYKKGFGKEYIDGLNEGLTTLKNVKKIRYENKHFINYAKIELYHIKNTIKYFFIKVLRIKGI